MAVNIPGTGCLAIFMLPLRIVVTLIFFSLMYPLFLIVGLLRAIFLRVVRGKPADILKTGRHNAAHMEDMHYPCHLQFKEALDETRLRKAIVELCAEDGIEEKMIDLKFIAEKPNTWPANGSWDIDHFIESNKRADNKGHHYWDYADERKSRGEDGVFVKMHIWNGDPGQPTIAYFFGSGNKWDGSSNYNFMKELMNRYMGNAPNKVFQEPEITAEAAAKFNEGSFILFLLQMPFAIAWTWINIVWNLVRAAKWAGGNGVGFKMTALNFTKEESAQLYAGAKALGVKPFAVFTYAAVKACKEVLGQAPTSITNQSSIQTRHYPLKDQTNRDLVGDWLLGPVQMVPDEFGLKEAQDNYTGLIKDLEEIGPATRTSFWAKAYGVFNSGAAGFELLPTYNTFHHPLNRQIFMNNYGVRTMPAGSPFHTWNWNAPLWFGVNTINVDGQTTTLVGSLFWGLEVVEAMRDHMVNTIRTEVMARAPPNAGTIPNYKMPTQKAVPEVTQADAPLLANQQ